MTLFTASLVRMPHVLLASLLVALHGGVPFFTAEASAEVVHLTGGDPSGGLALDPLTVVAALYTPESGGAVSPSATQVFQGVTFSATTSSIARGASPTGIGAYLPPFSGNLTASSAGFTNASSPTTEDNNLLSLMNAGAYFNTEYLTFTITNLTPNTSYRVDSLASVLGYNFNRSYTVAYNGGSVSGTLVSSTPAEGSYIFAFKDIVNSTGAGEIVVKYQQLTGDGPTVSGVVVSTVPEPSTCAMALVGLALGGHSMFRRRRLGS